MTNGSTKEEWIDSVGVYCPCCEGGRNTNAGNCKPCENNGKLIAKLVVKERVSPYGSTREKARVYCPCCDGGRNTNALDCKACRGEGFLMADRVI
jgi:hypothetical protein